MKSKVAAGAALASPSCSKCKHCNPSVLTDAFVSLRASRHVSPAGEGRLFVL